MKHNKITEIDATNLLMDHDIEKILIGTYDRSRSAIEISELYGIPIATCFKKIRKLKEMGLLMSTDIIYTAKGRKIELYTTNFDNAYVYYEGGKLKVRFEVVLQMTHDLRIRLEYDESRLAVKT